MPGDSLGVRGTAVSEWHGYRRRIPEAVLEYIDYMRSNGTAEGTIKSRRTAFNKMEEVLKDMYVHSVEAQHMTRVWTRCGRDREQTTLRVDYQAFKGFFEWCEDMKYRQRFESPFKHIKRPKIVKRERRRVAEEQFPNLLKAAEEIGGPRDRMFIGKGLYILGRKVEMNHIQIGDIDRSEGEIILFRSKVGQGDRMPISDELGKELDAYFEWYRWMTDTKTLDPNWYLVPRFTRPKFVPGSNRESYRGDIRPDVMMREDTGTRITKLALGAIGFPLVESETGKASMEGAHTLRRSGARALYNNLVEMGHDGAIRIVQMMLGHVKMSQTEEYIGLTLDRKMRNDMIKGKVMYRKAQPDYVAPEPASELEIVTGKTYGHLRVVS